MNDSSSQAQPKHGMDAQQLQSDIQTIRTVLDESERHNEAHRIVIAAGNVLSGLFLLVAVPFILMAIGIVGISVPDPAPGEPSATAIVGIALGSVAAAIMAISLPFFLAGWGVWKRKSWGTIMAVVAGILNLANVPLGTALGVYTFWAVFGKRLR